MFHALRYEPFGQRQRFDPHEQHSREGAEKHIHLHLHLNLTFRARQGRSIPANVNHLRRIFATLLAATVMPLAAFIFAFSIHDGPPDPLLSLGNLPFVLLFLGLALAWGFGYLPLLVSTWRASPQGRFRLLVPLLLLLSSSFLFLLALVFGAIPGPLMSLVLPLLIFLFLAQPLIMALLLMWISREARALHRTGGAQRRFSFVMVCGMVLALLGELLWYLSAMFSGGMLLVIVPLVILAALIVAFWTFLESRKSAQVRPKDASLFDVDSSEEPRGYRG